MTQRIGTLEAADLAGITYRQIDYWIRTGVIHVVDAWVPRGHRAAVGYVNLNHRGGSGSRTSLDAHELEVLILIAKLVRVGITLRVAHNAARQMVDEGSEYVSLGHGVVVAIREVADA
jgi:hypothetical protein